MILIYFHDSLLFQRTRIGKNSVESAGDEREDAKELVIIEMQFYVGNSWKSKKRNRKGK